MLVRTERISDLKSWLSGDGYYNLTPVFLLGASGNAGSGFLEPNSELDTLNERDPFVKSSLASQLASLFRPGLHMDKLFVMQFRSCKWHLQIGKLCEMKDTIKATKWNVFGVVKGC